MSGDCTVASNCVSSRLYPDYAYYNGDACEVTMLRSATLTVGSTFSISQAGVLEILGEIINDAAEIPTMLSTNDVIRWEGTLFSDYGWQICFERNTKFHHNHFKIRASQKTLLQKCAFVM